MAGGTTLFIRWAKQGVWDRLLDLVQRRRVTLGMTFIDGTTIRAHHKAVGAEKKGIDSTERDQGEALSRSRGGYGTKACVIANGHSSHEFRERLWNSNARPAIPSKTNEKQLACPAWIYHNRHFVENLWARLKEWRAIATRYEKTAQFFPGILCLAATAG